jgi:UDP-glucuronate 4-epimerase
MVPPGRQAPRRPPRPGTPGRQREDSLAMRILVTGSAGFIGFHVAGRLLRQGHQVVGLDSLVPYYDVRLKQRRHALLAELPGFTPEIADLVDAAAVNRIFAEHAPETVIHLAAQAGVRYAITHPETYVASNIQGTFHLLEACRARPVRHMLMASTSSAYGANSKLPFSEADPAATPLTIYAASKLAAEHIGHSYAHLWDLPVTAFRFFTVYGPWGRPDMALFKFTAAILEGRPIELYNNGDMRRDFTFIDDLADCVVRLLDVVPRRGAPVGPADTLSPIAPFRLVNIGNAAPVPLLEFVAEIERCLGRPAIRHLLPMQPGEVVETHADTTLLRALIGQVPTTPVADGVAAFVAWYRDHYAA